MKYFVITDVHSFYEEMIAALSKAGFDKKNPNHTLVSCGDLFDRGNYPDKCLEYVLSVPKKRRILIKGNHETLLDNLLHGKEPSLADVKNGTMKTICKLTGYKVSEYDKAIDALKNNTLLQKYYEELRDYYETEHYIFCHGWIPIAYDEEDENNDTYYRRASEEKWENARWVCGFSEWYWMHSYQDCKQTNKTIVCGHWHTSYAHSRYHNDGKEWPGRYERWRKVCNFGPFVDNGIIGLDASTAFTDMCNCYVLEEG